MSKIMSTKEEPMDLDLSQKRWLKYSFSLKDWILLQQKLVLHQQILIKRIKKDQEIVVVLNIDQNPNPTSIEGIH